MALRNNQENSVGPLSPSRVQVNAMDRNAILTEHRERQQRVLLEEQAGKYKKLVLKNLPMLLCELITFLVLVTLVNEPEIQECSSSFYRSVWALIGLEIYLICRKSLLLFVASRHDPERIAQFS